MDKAYSVAIMEVNGETHYLAATEGQGPCMDYNGRNWNGSAVWTHPGGTMNIVPIPGRKNEFIATQDFYPGFQAAESKIVHAKCDQDFRWSVSPIMPIPYLHRFDLFLLQGRLCFIGATLCEAKAYKEDWSQPGKVVVGEISDNTITPFELTPILEGVTKNHGFCHGTWNNRDAFFVSGVEGVFVLCPPETSGAGWETKQLLNHEVSDMAVCDLDEDGCVELATIEPFHGSRGIIYKNKGGQLSTIHEHEYEFGHVVWGGRILNIPSFIIGGRQGSRELNCFQMEAGTGRISHVTIDHTGGPSNIAVHNQAKSAVILAANRDIGEVAVYEITD